MKKIKKLFILPILAFLWFISLWVTNAYDDIDWEDLKVDYTYNSSSERLIVRLSVDSDTYPSDKYYADFIIDWKNYSRTFSYDSSEDELYIENSVSINEYDLEDEYEIDVRVFNDDEDDLVYDDVLTEEVNNHMNWNNLKVKTSYSNSRNYLSAEVYLNDVDKKPTEKYYSYFKVNWKTHQAEFVYSSSSDKFYAKHSIYFDDDDIDDNDDYEVIIKNSSYNEIFEDDWNLDLDNLDDDDNDYYYNDDDIRWSNVYISNYYDEDDEKMKIDFVIDDVNSKPDDDFTLKFKIDWKNYTKTLSYSSTNDKLYTSFYVNIDEDDIRDYYYIAYTITNKDRNRTEYTKTNLRMDTDSSYTSGDSKYKPKYYGYYDDEINWSNSKITTTYDDDYNNLQINFTFNDIDYNPKNDYSVKLNFAWKNFTKKLSYNSSLNKLTTTFYISKNESDLKSYYYVSYSVLNDDEDDYVEFAKPIFKLSVFDEVYPDDFWDMVKNDLVNSIIEKAENNYYKNTDKIKYLERTIVALTEQAKKNTKYKDFISSVNASLKEKIKYYKWTKEWTSWNLFPMFDY